MTDEKRELRLCPFCGWQPNYSTIDPSNDDVGAKRVRCDNCGATGPQGLGNDGSVCAWNNRTKLADREGSRPEAQGDDLETDELHYERIESGHRRGMYKVFETMTSEDICLCWKESRAKRIIEALATERELSAKREGFVWVPVERLEEIASALDRGLGDSDITHIESDEELKEDEPIQWACSQLNHLIAAAPKEGT